ncbi:MAG: transporter [Duodenibacillus sp.]|nr:transporter [Duodenibacillus sp.]
MKLSALRPAALFAALLVSSAAVCAAGFQLTEQSSLGLGRAYAGAGIVGDDLSAVHYNAAGMTLLPGTQIQAGSVWIELDLDYKGKDGTKDNGRKAGQAIPAGYVTHQIDDAWWVGLGLTVPYGMGTEFNKKFSALERGTSSTVLTFDINPNVAYKVNDAVSLGFGVSLQYAAAKLTSGSSTMFGPAWGTIKAKSWACGVNAGIMFQPAETVRLGLSYRSAIRHHPHGTYSQRLVEQSVSNPALVPMLKGMFNTKMRGNTFVETPDTVMLTATWEATQQLRLSGLLRWAKWSNFDELVIKGSGQVRSVVRNDWGDAWLVSLGADYKFNDTWTGRCGIAYEKSPIKEAETRTAVIPDGNRLWLSVGGSYHHSKNLQLDVGFTYLTAVSAAPLYASDASKEKIGKYKKLDAYLIGAQLQYRF